MVNGWTFDQTTFDSPTFKQFKKNQHWLGDIRSILSDSINAIFFIDEVRYRVRGFLNVGTPSGVHLFDHLLWSILLNMSVSLNIERACH